jgi:zinc/manganese transport system permease protein
VQISAFGTAIVGALALNWTEKRYAEAQEPIIGVVFILAATAGVLLLSGNVHAGESLRDLLVGQILWVNPERLPYAALVYAIVLAIWFSLRERIGRLGFYLLFACTVTVSVQLVGVYLVFASLIIPPLAIRRLSRYRLPWSYAIGALGYGLGISASVLFDLPTGPIIVWTLAVLGILAHTAIKPNAASGVAASLTVGTEGTRSGS